MLGVAVRPWAIGHSVDDSVLCTPRKKLDQYLHDQLRPTGGPDPRGRHLGARRRIPRRRPLPPVHPGLPERAPSPTQRRLRTSTQLFKTHLIDTSLPWRTSRLC
jgi:hypothetical protein